MAQEKSIPLPQSVDSALSNIQQSSWMEEIKKHSKQFHRVGAWVAIFFDPLFGITDYFNIPDQWIKVMILRLVVAAMTFLGLMLHKRGKIDTFLMIAIPFTLISLQNAYTYSLLGPEHVLGHNLNYLALFMGAGLFILWPLRYSLIIIGISLITSFYFVSTNAALELSEFAVAGGLLLIAGAIFTILLIQARFRLRLREIQARLALQVQLEITEQQKTTIQSMNERLLDYNKELEREVAARTESLRKANEERDKLVYRLSHDFKTPILNVRSLVSMMKMQGVSEANEPILAHLMKNVDRFEELLGDMMNYAVYANDSLEPRPINLEEKVANVWKNLTFLHQDQFQPTLNLKNGAEQPLVHDPEKLRVLLYCLLSNSLRFGPESGERRIVVEAASSQSGWLIQVKDNGTGIPKEIMPRIFDMFFRGDVRSNGSGLGLFVAKGIAEQLGGTLTVESEVNKGTTVTIHLPAQMAMAS